MTDLLVHLEDLHPSHVRALRYAILGYPGVREVELIAAAPELLEALKALVLHAASESACTGDCEFADNARAVIAQAEGQKT